MGYRPDWPHKVPPASFCNTATPSDTTKSTKGGWHLMRLLPIGWALSANFAVADAVLSIGEHGAREALATRAIVGAA